MEELVAGEKRPFETVGHAGRDPIALVDRVAGGGGGGSRRRGSGDRFRVPGAGGSGLGCT